MSLASRPVAENPSAATVLAYSAGRAMVTGLRRGAQVRHRLPRRALAAVRRYAVWIAAGWVLVPLALWFVVIAAPPTPIAPPPLLPGTTASSTGWSQPTSEPTALGHLVVASQHALGPADRSYYDTLISRLRTDAADVESAVGTWSDPLTADIAASPNHRGAYGLVWLNGALGSAQARSAVDAVNRIIASVPAPAGTHAYLTGPATAFAMPASPSGPTAAAILAAVLLVIAVAVHRVCRPKVRLTVLAYPAATALFAAAPVGYLLAAAGRLSLSPLSVALGGVLTACAAIDFALVITRSYHRQRRAGTEHDGALVHAYCSLLRHAAVAAPVLTALLFVSVFLHTPLLRGVTAPAAIGVLVALLTVTTLVPGLIGRSAQSPQWTESWAGRLLTPPLRRRGLITAAATACTLVAGATAVSVHNASEAMPSDAGPFPLSQVLPDVVTIASDHDLRSPDGLAAINLLTRRLLALPGVIRVQSPSAPAGMPWDQATFAFQAGSLGKQASQSAASANSQLVSVKSLASTLDTLSDTIDRARGGGGGGDFARAAADVGSGVQSLQRAAAAVTSSLTPIQEWMQGMSDCSDNALCASAQRLMGPFANVLRSVSDLGRGTAQMFDGRPGPALPADALGQLQAVVSQLRGLVPGLARLLDTVLPQIGSLATSMKGIGQNFGDSSQGAFYLPRSVIDSAAYRSVRDSMFTADGHSTRLLVYGALDNAAMPLWQRPTTIAQVLAAATRDGALTDSTVTVSGTGTAAQQLRDLARHDATALGLCFMVLTALAAAAMARHRRAVLLLSALSACFLLAGAAVWISVTDIVVGEITWLALLLAMTVAGPMAVHHHVSMAGRARVRRPFRQPANVLCLAGITFGVAIWLAPGDALLHRAGLLMAIGLSVNATTITISRRSLVRLPATARSLWITLTTPESPTVPVRRVPVQPVPEPPVAPMTAARIEPPEPAWPAPRPQS
ncbi:MAG: MMPL family transporter, partial [Mycobacterium sp.]